MCNSTLWAVFNHTGVDALLSSTNGVTNTCAITHSKISHTRPINGFEPTDFLKVPDCSSQVFYPGHHMTIRATDQSWSVFLWSDDQQGCQLFWNTLDQYEGGTLLGGGSKDPNSSLLIFQSGGVLKVHRFSW
jgi:hypothetical protein